MISAFILPFDKRGKELQVNGVNFLNVDTKNMTAFLPEIMDETQACSPLRIFKLFSGLIPFNGDKKAVQLSLFLDNTHGLTQNLGVFYLNDNTILPVRFAVTAAFASWSRHLMQETVGAYYFIINSTTCKGHACEDYISKHNPFKEIGSWIHKLAPRGYTTIKDCFLKENYLSQFMGIHNPIAQPDLFLLEQQWKQLLLLKHLDAHEAITEPEIYDAFEEETCMTFPEELKTILRISNGVAHFIEDTEFLSATQIFQEWKNWNAIYHSYNFLELVDDFHHKNHNEKMVPMYVNPYRVPFIHDGGGNFIGIDLLPNKAGKKGQVIAYGVDEIMVRCLAENMGDFLQQILDGKNPMKNDWIDTKPNLVIGF
jgi:cell wall assembly regulator SMI1